MKDRFAAYKQSKKDQEKVSEMQTRRLEKKNKIRKQIEYHIDKIGDKDLIDLWNKFDRPLDDAIDSMVGLIQGMAVSHTGNYMEKMMTHFSYKCIKCKDTLVPDGVCGDPTKDKPLPEMKSIDGQFVCLTCGEKYKLVEIEG